MRRILTVAVLALLTLGWFVHHAEARAVPAPAAKTTAVHSSTTGTSTGNTTATQTAPASSDASAACSALVKSIDNELPVSTSNLAPAILNAAAGAYSCVSGAIGDSVNGLRSLGR